MQALYDKNYFETTRVFPTHNIGTQEGWYYLYPVMEVRGRPSNSQQF